MEPHAPKGQKTLFDVGYTKRKRFSDEQPSELRIRLDPDVGWRSMRSSSGTRAWAQGSMRARALGRMLLSQAMEAGAGAEAGGGAEGGGEGGVGEEGLSQWRCPRSQRRTHLKRTQTCKWRGCCDTGRECRIERARVKRNDWRCLTKTKYSWEN